MKTVRIAWAALFAVVVPGGVSAQQAAPAAAPAATAQDCARQLPRHDHGAERGIPNPRARASSCPPEAAASGVAKRKPKPTHDHGKMHKNQ